MQDTLLVRSGRLKYLFILIPSLLLPLLVVWLSQSQPAAAQTEPSVEFTSTSYTVGESAGTASINISISTVPTLTTNTVTVTYATADGTATAGADYVATSGVITFTVGDPNTKSFSVTINSDVVVEGTETVVLVLQDPINATLDSPNIVNLNITDDDPTATPTSSAATPVFADIYESNNTLPTAYTINVNDTSFCSSPNATLWPAGDIDYYRFFGRAGGSYQITTQYASGVNGLDTFISIFDGNGNLLGQNDDGANGTSTSSLTLSTSTDQYYYIEVLNRDGSDPADKRYCVQVLQIPGTSTPIPTPTPERFFADICEDNFNIHNSCLIAADGISQSYNFLPKNGDGPDNDFYKLWVREGWTYTCETFVDSYSDTNMIFYDAHGNGINGNNDKTFNDLGSRLSYVSTYTGWLYILVGSVIPIDIDDFGGDNASIYTYQMNCLFDANTPTPTLRPTTAFVPGAGSGGGGGTTVRTPTPTATPTIDPNATATIDLVQTIQALETQQAAQPDSTAVPQVGIVPLPTNTPQPPQIFNADFTVILFYDQNENNLPELSEGVEDTAVLVYDAATEELLSLGYTNDAGTLRFGVTPSSDFIRISIPYLGINQTFSSGVNEILIRVAPTQP